MAKSPDWMIPDSVLRDGHPLDTQCRGRPLSERESALADALEKVFSQGIHDMAAVAAVLSADGIEAPTDGGTDWTEEKLAAEITTINASLDRAYEEDGYGA